MKGWSVTSIVICCMWGEQVKKGGVFGAPSYSGVLWSFIFYAFFFPLRGTPFLCWVFSRRGAISRRRCSSELMRDVISPDWSLLFVITWVTGNALCPLESQTCAFLMLTTDANILLKMASSIFTIMDVNRHILKKMDMLSRSNYTADLEVKL